MWPFNEKRNKDSVRSLWGMLEGSPFYLLLKHMRTSVQCANCLGPFMDNVLNQDWQQVEVHHKEIIAIEDKADRLKNKLRVNLHKSLMLPVSRADLLAILAAQDNIANTTKDIAGIVQGRRMEFPKSLQPKLREFYSTTLRACQLAEKIVREIDDLFQSGFSANMIRSTEEMIHDLDAIEEKTDHLQIEVRKLLFECEKTLPAVDVIFLYKVIENIGNLGDWAQRVGAKLLILLAH